MREQKINNILYGTWKLKQEIPVFKKEIPHNLVILKVENNFVISVTKNILSYVKRFNKTIIRFDGFGKVVFHEENPPKAKVFKCQLLNSKKEAEFYRTEFTKKFKQYKKKRNPSMRHKREYFFDLNSPEAQIDVNMYFNKLNNESILKVG